MADPAEKRTFWLEETKDALHAFSVHPDHVLLVSHIFGKKPTARAATHDEFIRGLLNDDTTRFFGPDAVRIAQASIRSLYEVAPAPAALVPITKCAICCSLPNHANLKSHYRRGEGEDVSGDSPGGAVEKLVRAGAPVGRYSSRAEIRRCPDCLTYYSMNHTSDSDPGERWDEETFERLLPTEAIRRFGSDEPGEIALIAGRWDEIVANLERGLGVASPNLGKYCELALDACRKAERPKPKGVDVTKLYPADVPVRWNRCSSKKEFDYEAVVEGTAWYVEDLDYPDLEYVYHLVIGEDRYGLLDWPRAWISP